MTAEEYAAKFMGSFDRTIGRFFELQHLLQLHISHSARAWSSRPALGGIRGTHCEPLGAQRRALGFGRGRRFGPGRRGFTSAPA